MKLDFSGFDEPNCSDNEEDENENDNDDAAMEILTSSSSKWKFYEAEMKTEFMRVHILLSVVGYLLYADYQ